jgi:multiple sugar transport system ATP-binding protein
MAGLRLVGLTKRFGEVVAASSVNLEISDGEFLVLVGPSGCGKTTVLRMIAGLEEPTDGEIWIGDRMVNDLSPKDRDIAMVFQNYALYPHMTVYDNMAFALKMSKVPREEIERRVQSAAEMLAIGNLLQRRPRELSGGQRQRVAVGRAIVRKPAAFLMDEPLSNLDAKLRTQTRTELIRLHRALGITTVYVTHDQMEAMTMGDRIVVMRDGLIQQIAAPLDLYNHPVNRFVAGFIGSPPMNFLDATIDGQNGDLYVDTGNFRLRLPGEMAQAVRDYSGEPVTLGIRPSDIALATGGSNGSAVTMQVEVAEPMGAETVLYLRSGEDTIVASVDSSTAVVEDQPIQVVIDTAKTHLFSAQNEATLF